VEIEIKSNNMTPYKSGFSQRIFLINLVIDFDFANLNNPQKRTLSAVARWNVVRPIKQMARLR
jgi:hypothetical protein